MSADELDKIIKDAPGGIQDILWELRPKIVDAARAVLEESQDSETAKATVKVGLSLSIELNCSPVAWCVEASVGVRHKIKGPMETADTHPELAPNIGKGRRANS